MVSNQVITNKNKHNWNKMIITITEKDLTKGEIEVLRQVLNHYFKTDLQIETTLKEIIFKDN